MHAYIYIYIYKERKKEMSACFAAIGRSPDAWVGHHGAVYIAAVYSLYISSSIYA